MKKQLVRAGYLIIAISLLGIASCGTGQNKAHNKTTIDEHTRIISLNGTITEVLCGLGLESSIVGVDITSNYPQSVLQLPQVGYVRSIAAEKVLALTPTLVMAFKEGMKPELKEQFTSANIGTLIFEQEYSIEGTKQFIRAVADTFALQEKAETLITKIDEDLKGIETLTSKPKVLFIYARGAGALMVAGQNTPMQSIITLAGGENAVSDFDEFKPLTAEALVAANPDIILMFDQGLESLGGIDGLLKVPGVAQVNAGKNKHIIEIDGQFLAGFGPRVGEAAVYLNNRFKEFSR